MEDLKQELSRITNRLETIASRLTTLNSRVDEIGRKLDDIDTHLVNDIPHVETMEGWFLGFQVTLENGFADIRPPILAKTPEEKSDADQK